MTSENSTFFFLLISPPWIRNDINSVLFAITGTLYGLLEQYHSSVCKSSLSRRPDVSLYAFIYQQVNSFLAPDDCDGGSARQQIPTDSC